MKNTLHLFKTLGLLFLLIFLQSVLFIAAAQPIGSAEYNKILEAYKKAKPVIQGANVLVLADHNFDLFDRPIRDAYVKMKIGTLPEPVVVNLPFGTKAKPKGNGDLISPETLWVEIVNLDFKQQVAILKECLWAASNTKLREEVINKAYLEVYGWYADGKAKALWEQKLVAGRHDWYISILEATNKELNANMDNRTYAINNVFNHVYGRKATEAEMMKWKDMKENYTKMYNENIDLLYSPENVKELEAMVKRVYEKTGGPMNTQIMKDMIRTAQSKRWSFKQLVYHYFKY